MLDHFSAIAIESNANANALTMETAWKKYKINRN